ncbi:hypothetical protein AZ19_3626 [Bordetella bronchiseptica E012]|nr:hypothetical protein AZ19_3626 [Bordetella bronchiseptica E012]
METFRVAYPFALEEYSGPKDGEFYDGKTWRPGIRFEVRDSGYLYDPDQVAIADGMGQMVLEVVSRHKPGKFPERTFFLRSFVDPNGRAFGKARLRVTTTPAFKRMAAGYRHEFEMAAQPTTSAKGPDHGR